MILCENCIHDKVCGLEGHLDEALTICVDRIADVQLVRRGYWKPFMMSAATDWELSLTGGRDEICEYN